MRGKLGFLLVVGMITMSLSCAKDDCGASCPAASFTSRLLSGTATFASADGSQDIVRVGEECDSEFVWSSLADDSASPSVQSPVSPLECTSGSNKIALSLNFLGDARWLSVSKYMWSPPDAGVSVVGLSQVRTGGLREGIVTVDVTRAEGKAARYPQLVTSDYVRRYTVHIEATEPQSAGGRAGLVADFEVEQVANDVVARPDTVCYCL